MRSSLFQKISLLYTSKKLPWYIIGVGVILRLVQYLFNRSLWVDESMLALNIIDRSFLELLQPLSYNQGAPIGFLMLEKMVVQIFNSSEYALRLLPFLLGVTSLFLFYGVAKRFIKPEAVPIALSLFAISDPLIYYSSEAKQYSGDVFIVLLLLYLVAMTIQSKKLAVSRVMSLGVLGSTTIWFSHPSVFVLPGIGASLTFFYLVKKEWAKIGCLSIVFSLWALSLIACYLVSLRSLSTNETLLGYWSWQNAFMPSFSLSQIRWFIDAFFGIFKYPVHLTSGIAALTFLVGSISIFSQERLKFSILMLPILFVLIASSFHLYPFKGRLLLFLVPSLLLFIAEGTEQIREKTRSNSTIIGTVIICLLFLQPLFYASYRLIKPRVREEIRPVISYISEHKQFSDILYIYYPAYPGYKYYSKRFSIDNNNCIVGVNPRENWVNCINDLDKLLGNKRVWMLFSNPVPWKHVAHKEFFLNYLDSVGTRLDEFKSTRASVYLYDLNDQQISSRFGEL